MPHKLALDNHFSTIDVNKSVNEEQNCEAILASTSKSFLGKTQHSAEFSGSHINQN